MVGVIIYVTNIVKGLRVITQGRYDVELVEGEAEIARQMRADGGGGSVLGDDAPGTIGRDESLRVLSASNAILALVLVGVLVLQAGQWYAERKQGQEEEEMRVKREERLEKRANAASTGGSSSSSSKGESTGSSGGGAGGHDLRHKSPSGSRKKV